ncbi:hypothetical protein AAMO2058_000073000 [Amorphochlora amoebiformis]
MSVDKQGDVSWKVLAETDLIGRFWCEIVTTLDLGSVYRHTMEPNTHNKKMDIDMRKAMPTIDEKDPKFGQLWWFNKPESSKFIKGTGIQVSPKAETDFWRKTYRSPAHSSISGHALVTGFPAGWNKCHGEVTFSIDPKILYDQAGIIVYIDPKNWIKAGIEMEKGVPRMSCVVTQGQSDWSYFTWNQDLNDIKLRLTANLYKKDNIVDCLIEYYDAKKQWQFLREAPLRIPEKEVEKEEIKSDIWLGCMCCAPQKKLVCV